MQNAGILGRYVVYAGCMILNDNLTYENIVNSKI